MKNISRFRIGLRTIKTTAAVIISMLIVEALGTTDSKLIFAMLGAMAAVQPTFKESLESCLAQIIGVLFGAIVGVALRFLNFPSLVATGIGIVLVITLYNILTIRFSPSLPCFIVVMICTTPDVQPLMYAAGRIWDTAIGLGIGMLINMLIFPYDNSRQIRTTAQSLDKELILFLEDMFDGDDILPTADDMLKKTHEMEKQLKIFSNQKLFLRRKHQKKELENLLLCEKKVHELVARMEILSCVGHSGRLNEENRRKLIACGARIEDQRPLEAVTEKDVVVNYHIRQILRIRRELLEVLNKH